MQQSRTFTVELPERLATEVERWAAGRLLTTESAIRHAVDQLLHPWPRNAAPPPV